MSSLMLRRSPQASLEAPRCSAPSDPSRPGFAGRLRMRDIVFSYPCPGTRTLTRTRVSRPAASTTLSA